MVVILRERRVDEPSRFPAQRCLPREEPLEPVCVVARGPVAERLAGHLLTWPDQSQRGERCLADLSAARVLDGLFLLGEAQSLPWVDGVAYLGRDPDAPELLLPTHAAPALPLSWLQAAVGRALQRRAEAFGGPVALTFEPPRIVSLAAARALSREDLEHWRVRSGRSEEAEP